MLDQLAPSYREEVRALLAAYDGAPVETVRPRVAEQAQPLGLSPWLEARVRSAGPSLGFSMTPAATAALRGCIPALGDEARPVSRPRAPTPGRANGLDGLLTRLRGRR